MVIKTCSVPVYNPECLDLIPDSDIALVTEDDIFLEMLLLKIKGETIKFASKFEKRK